MAIKPAVKYPGKSAPASDAYPLGAARDITTPGDGTGTPLQKDWVNDIWGFLQAILAEGGVTASGSPDTAQVSQYLAGLKNRSARYYASRAALTANTSAQYLDGQVIEVAGVKWTVATGTANGMDILQLPGGKVAVYVPERGIVYAAALGYGSVADSTAIFNRCLAIGQTIVLPSGRATTLQPVTIPDDYSIITDTPGTVSQINISGTGDVGTFKLDGVSITLRDLRFNGAGRAIAATAAVSNLKCSGLEFVSCLRSIWFGAQTVSNIQLNNITMTNCAEGIEGSAISGLVVTGLTANADSVGSFYAASIDCNGGYLQWNSHNTAVNIRSGNMTLVPGVLNADSVLNSLIVASGTTVQVLCPPVLTGSAAVSVHTGATANGFIGADYSVETAGYSRNHANSIEDVAIGEASYYSDAQIRLKAGASGGEVLIAPSGTTLTKGLNAYDGLSVLTGEFRVASPTVPASAGATGATGRIAWDSGYLYVCVAPNTWKRAAIATW